MFSNSATVCRPCWMSFLMASLACSNFCGRAPRRRAGPTPGFRGPAVASSETPAISTSRPALESQERVSASVRAWFALLVRRLPVGASKPRCRTGQCHRSRVAVRNTLPPAGAHRGGGDDRRFQSRQLRLCSRATTLRKSGDQCRDMHRILAARASKIPNPPRKIRCFVAQGILAVTA